jgi:hypothetical protein
LTKTGLHYIINYVNKIYGEKIMKGILKKIRGGAKITLALTPVALMILGGLAFVTTMTGQIATSVELNNKYINSDDIKTFQEEQIDINKQQYENGEIAYADYLNRQTTLTSDDARKNIAADYYKDDENYQGTLKSLDAWSMAEIVSAISAVGGTATFLTGYIFSEDLLNLIDDGEEDLLK